MNSAARAAYSFLLLLSTSPHSPNWAGGGRGRGWPISGGGSGGAASSQTRGRLLRRTFSYGSAGLRHQSMKSFHLSTTTAIFPACVSGAVKTCAARSADSGQSRKGYWTASVMPPGSYAWRFVRAAAAAAPRSACCAVEPGRPSASMRRACSKAFQLVMPAIAAGSALPVKLALVSGPLRR